MTVAAVLGVWAAAIGGYDGRRKRVPNAALVLALVPAILALALQGQGLLGERWSLSLLGMALAFGLTLPGYLLRQLGAGDVKFAAVLGLLLGATRSFEMMLVASLLMGAMALSLRSWLPRGARFPAAPVLAAAFIAEAIRGPFLL